MYCTETVVYTASQSDTTESIKKKIAVQYRTTVSNLLFTPDESLERTNIIEVLFIRESIQSSECDPLLVKILQDRDVDLDRIIVYAAYHILLSSDEHIDQNTLCMLLQDKLGLEYAQVNPVLQPQFPETFEVGSGEIRDHLDRIRNIPHVNEWDSNLRRWAYYHQKMDDYQEILRLREQVEEEKQTWIRSQPTLSTDVKEVSSSVTGTFDLHTLFDTLTTSLDIPFAVFCTEKGEQLYKVYSHITTVEESWKEAEGNTIVFYLRRYMKRPKTDKYTDSHYSRCVITPSSIEFNATVKDNEDLHTKRTIVDTAFGLEVTHLYTDSTTTMRVVYHCLPENGYTFNSTVLEYVITTHPHFSQYFYLREIIDIPKKVVVFTVDKMKIEFEVVVGGLLYLVVYKMVQDNISSALHTIGCLIHYVQEHTARIVEEASKYGVQLQRTVLTKNESLFSMSPRDVAPEIFKTSFARQCQSKNSTSVVTKFFPDKFNLPEKGNFLYEDREYTAIRFPLEEGVAPQMYACINSTEYTQIGLKYTSDKEVPYIPCCYTRTTKGMTSYLRGEGIEVGKSLTEFMTTIKFCSPNLFGKVPSLLQETLQSIMIDAELQYCRYGIEGVEDSFLQACFTALYPKESYQKNRSWFLQQIQPYLPCCLQNAWMYTPESLYTWLRSSDYINPRIFYRAVEEAFQINIVLFKAYRDDVEIMDIFHKHSYYYYGPFPETIFILEHYGSESNKSSIPRSELIVGVEYGLKIERTVPRKYIFDIALQLFPKRWLKSTEIDRSTIPSAIEQYVDEYGKCRALKVAPGIILCCDPIPPLALPIFHGSLVSDPRKVKDYIIPYGYTVKTEEKISATDRYRHNIKLASYIIENAIFLYSKMQCPDIEEFMQTYVVLDPKIQITTLNRRLGHYLLEDILYVQDEIMYERVKYNLVLQCRRDKEKVLSYYKQEYIPNSLTTIDDFTPRPNTVPFISKRSLETWMKRLTTSFELRDYPSASLDTQFVKIGEEIYRITQIEKYSHLHEWHTMFPVIDKEFVFWIVEKVLFKGKIDLYR